MHRRYRSHRRSSALDYVIPFLIFICIGVVVVLLFNLWRAIFAEEQVNGGYVHIVEGSVELRAWKTDKFFNLSSDTLVLQGDELRVSADGLAIMEFFDGTIMRLDGGTNIVLDEISAEDDLRISLLLVDGSLWFNKLYKSTDDTDLVVAMDNIQIHSTAGSIFELENDFEEVVRVLHGENVDVSIFTEDNEKVVETESLGVGQQIVFTEDVLQSYWQFKSPTVLTALSDEFKASEWYAFNDQEDKEPTEFVYLITGNGSLIEVEPEILGDPDAEGEEGSVDGEETENPEDSSVEEDVMEEDQPEAALNAPAKPTISSVAGIGEPNADGFYVVTSNLATLEGTVSGAAQIMVNDYTLQQFSAGSSSWTYYANADYGLMQEGENIYQVYAVAEDGTKSEPLTVKVLYKPQVAQPAEPEPEKPAASEEVQPEEVGPEESDEGGVTEEI